MAKNHSITPFQFEDHSVRVVTDDHGEPWFIAKEIADVLGYSDAFEMTKKLDDDEKSNLQIAGMGPATGGRGITIINEAGLYSCILTSQKPEAKRFKRWVTHEVLPSIRKTGSYTHPRPETGIKSPSNPLPHVKAHMTVAAAMEKLGVRKEMAMAVALKAIHEDTGMTTEGYRLALPSVEDVGTLNQTQLGELIGVSSREIGKRLRDAGLMIVDESGTRVPTEKGLQFGEVKPYKAFNGHAGYEIRWNKSVLDFLAQMEVGHE